MPLDVEGRNEATRLAHRFAKDKVVEIYCSPLDRAQETARAIAKSTGAPLHINFALMPWHLGYMTGEPVKSVLPIMNYHVEHEDEPVRGGEPFSVYRKRFLGFLKRKAEESSQLYDGNFILLVTHSRGLQITKSWLKAGSPDDLSISVPRMLDYKDETKTGGELSLYVKSGRAESA